MRDTLKAAQGIVLCNVQAASSEDPQKHLILIGGQFARTNGRLKGSPIRSVIIHSIFASLSCGQRNETRDTS